MRCFASVMVGLWLGGVAMAGVMGGGGWERAAWSAGPGLLLLGPLTWMAHRRIARHQAALAAALDQDRTQRDQRERDLHQAKLAAEQANHAKSQFLASMSHEIRTPLHGIVGMTDLLLTTRLSDEQRQFVRVCQSSANALTAIIGDILDFSRIEAEHVELDMADFDLASTVEDVVEMVAQQAQERGLELLCEIDPPRATWLRGDPARLQQVVMNLLSNAVKFTEHGTVTAGVHVDPPVDRRCAVTIRVSDTGIGIEPRKMARLFESFDPGDRSNTRRFGGAGLGLAISKRLIDLLGGTITAQSQQGAGTTFTVSLNLPVAENQPASIVPQARRLRVLVADHHNAGRQIAVRQLTAWGMVPYQATHADRVLPRLDEALREGRPFDLLLIDQSIADTGVEACLGEVRRRPEHDRVRVLVISPMNAGLPDEIRAALRIDATVSKPLRPSQLFDAIAEACPIDHDEASHAAPIVPAAPPPGPPLHLLVVDDSRVNRLVAQKMLEKLGHTCDLADDGSQAVAAVAARRYDAVLMDCQMPEVDGFEATRRIRQREQEAAGPRVRIIALTANALKGDREQCLQAGMDDYLSKPIEREDLRRALGAIRRPDSPPAADAA